MYIKQGEKPADREAYRAAYQKFCYQGVPHTDLAKQELTVRQLKIYNLAKVGWNKLQIAKRLGITAPAVHDGIRNIKLKGWEI